MSIQSPSSRPPEPPRSPYYERRQGLRILAAFALAATTAWVAFDGRGTPARDRPPAPTFRIDVNTAPPGVLEALPMIGPALAARIVEGRDEAPFVSLADLDARVRGIGPVTVARLRPFLRFD